MCGIAGIININAPEQLKQMIAQIAHRGPDDEGTIWFEKIRSGLGHRRLSILDLSQAGHQPMRGIKDVYWISYNGEVYNYLEIKKELQNLGVHFVSNSDTEVIIKGYEIWGKNILHKLNGMFAFAILNKNTGELFAARDRIGIKPFYYSQINGGLIFASEIKSILKTRFISPEPDWFALHTPTRFQVSPLTGFKNIYKLPPAHFLVFKNGQLKIEKYWDLHPEELIDNEAIALHELDNLLNNTIKFQMISDVEVGAFLSGGLDSSLITVLMAKNTSKKINTFTIKFTNEDQKFEKMPDDSFYSNKLASYFGFNHTEIEINPDVVELLPKLIWHVEEPLADPASINTYLISKKARESGIVVLLNGMGGDEIFGGYRKHLACLKAEIYRKILPGLLRLSLRRFSNIVPVASNTRGFKIIRWGKRFLNFADLPRAERFLSSDLSLNPDEFKELFHEEVDYYQTHFYLSQRKNFSLENVSYLTQMCLNDTKVFLPEHNLLYSDKSTMAIGVEARPPLTDHRIVEFMFKVAPFLRIKGNKQKFLLKKVSEKYLPSEIIHRPKAPFGSPLRSWIRVQLKDIVDEYLDKKQIEKRGLYNSDYVINKIKLDREGKEDNAHLIWQLLTIEIWFRTFFD